MSTFILLSQTLKVTLIALIINVILAVVVEVVEEVEAVVAAKLKLSSSASTITCYIVIDRVWVCFVVGNNSGGVERVVQLKEQVWRPPRVANIVFGGEA
jgi:hypothetical protein